MDRAAALDAASHIDRKIEDGIDPQISPQIISPKPSAPNTLAFEYLIPEFLKHYKTRGGRKKGPVKPKTYQNGKSLLLGDRVSQIKNLDVRKISRAQIIQVLEDMSDTPYLANRLHSYLSVFFNWCWNSGYIDSTPMYKLEKIFREEPRTRFLSIDEIRKFWSGCTTLGYPLGDLGKFILATGQRPGECRRLNRLDIDRNVWLVEGGNPKNKERHRIPLPHIANQIAESSSTTGDYVFSEADGEFPCHQSGDSDEAIYKAVDLASPWQLRDLRRTFQTHASEELDFDPHIIGVICNQKSVSKPGVARIYNQAKWIKQKKAALDKWNDWLLKVVKSD